MNGLITSNMTKYKFYVPYEDARRVDIPKDVAVEPYPSSLKELIEATKDFYSLWYGLDWDRREVIRLGRIPYASSYEYGREEKDMEVWLVVGSPTRGLIFVRIDPEGLRFMQTSGYSHPCYVFDLIYPRACWFLLWKKKALRSMTVLRRIRSPRDKPKRKERVIYVESRKGIKHMVKIIRKTRHRISFSFDFEGEKGLYRLSKDGEEELGKLADWIFKEIEKRHGNSWLPLTRIYWGFLSFYVEGLPKDLFDEVLEKLRDIARRGLQKRFNRW